MFFNPPPAPDKTYYTQEAMKRAPNMYVSNPYSKGTYNRVHPTKQSSRMGASRSTVQPLFNPNFVESWTGIGYNGEHQYANDAGGATHTYHPRDMQQLRPFKGGINVNDNGLAAKQWITGLSDNGDKVVGMDGKEYKLTPTMVRWLKNTVPVYTPGSEANEDAIKAQLNKTIGGMYEGQGIWSALTGHQAFNDEIISGNNGLYQWAQAAIQSGDKNLEAKGRAVLQAVANSQYIYNEAQPLVTKVTQQAIADKKKQIRNWFGNNWWWAIPGGALLLGGIGSLFGGGLANMQGQQTAMPGSVPQQPRTPLPDQWTTSLVPETNGGLA